MKRLIFVFTVLSLLSSPILASRAFAQDGDTNSNALYARILAALHGLHQDSSAQDEFVYIMNDVPGNLAQVPQFLQAMPNVGPITQAWVSNGFMPSANQLGIPSTFAQVWKQSDSNDNPIAAGSSHLNYPASFQLDPAAHPHLVVDFVNKTATLPTSP
jgi:hypothetical protein